MPLQRRVDWSRFLASTSQVHGVRVDVPGFKATSNEARVTERHLLAILRVYLPNLQFSLRRSFRDGPARIDCAFGDVAGADDLARLIGAAPCPPPVGFKIFRVLVANKKGVQHLRDLGKDKRTYPRRSMLERVLENGAPKQPARRG